MIDTSPIQTCRHCGQRTDFWLWRLIECCPHFYEILCMNCIRQQDAGFTADAAIAQARGIVLFERAVLSGRVVRAAGGDV